jgi:hypothetical protein
MGVTDVMLGKVRSVSSLPNGQGYLPWILHAIHAWLGPGSGHMSQGHNIQGTLCSRGTTSKNFRSGTHRSGTHQPCID